MSNDKEALAAKLNNQLPYFSGSEHWYRHSLNRRMTYTDGVRFVAETAGAYWLLDEIALTQGAVRKGWLRMKAAGQPVSDISAFQHWKLKVQDQTGVLSCDDGDGHIVYEKRIEYTDFPLDEIGFYVEPGGPENTTVILLPGER